MKNNPNHIDSTCPDILEWYTQEIKKCQEELLELHKKIKDKVDSYISHMFSNTGKAYNLTKKDSLTDRVRLSKEFKKDYQDLQNQYLSLQALITRKFFLEDTIIRLKHDRQVDYEQLRNKDN